MSDDMKLLKSRLEKRLKEAAAENGGVIDHEAMEGTAGGIMIALYEIDHLHEPELWIDDLIELKKLPFPEALACN